MQTRLRRCGIVLALAAAACATPRAESPLLRFSAATGDVGNEFFREGAAAAHLVVTPGGKPRLIVAFPAGNSGAAVFFDARSAIAWESRGLVRASRGAGKLHGVTVDLLARGGSLVVRQAIVGSTRVIRSYQEHRELPAEVATAPRVAGRTIVWQRPRLDGGSGYYLALEVVEGELKRERGSLELAPADGRLKLRVTALTGDSPLTPIPEDEVFTERAGSDVRLRNTLRFLAYREKLLAGSWRFNTYFGRDTLMSLLLLGDAVKPALIEAGLGAVLERLNGDGEVAHEEEIGEFAVLQRKRAGLPLRAAPRLDYKMVDDDFMLAPVAAKYLLRVGAERARAFLERRSAADALTFGARLARNFHFVLTRAAPFAKAPDWSRLIALKPGESVGNWRDSNDGLGGGRYPFDVNGVWVPAALEAIAKLCASGRLDAYVDETLRAECGSAAASAKVWQQSASRMFEVVQPTAAAHAAAERYARSLGIPGTLDSATRRDTDLVATPAPRPPPPTQPPQPYQPPAAAPTFRFHAVALRDDGSPIPIANSDEALGLLLSDPPPAEAQRIAALMTTPFPAGLMTDVGPVVANAAYAPPELAPRFDRNHYHGAVIWSWQQAVLAAGLERQLKRSDLPPDDRAALAQARARVRASIEATRTLRASELWSWTYENDHFRAQPFGASEKHETESNAAQLWSTVYLGLP